MHSQTNAHSVRQQWNTRVTQKFLDSSRDKEHGGDQFL